MVKRTVLLFIFSLLLLSSSCSQRDQAVPSVRQSARVDNLLLLDAVRTGGRIVAAGERGQVLFSDDDGETWRRAAVPTGATLTCLFFSDEQRGWAAGHDAVILRTLDGGGTWEQIQSAPEQDGPLLDLWFTRRGRGFAVGAYGQFYATADGGATWSKKRATDDDMHLNAIAGGPEGPDLLAGEAGTLYRSDDNGSSWRRLPSPYRGSFFGVLNLDAGGTLLFGLRGHLYRSDDKGRTWRPLSTGSEASLFGGADLGSGVIVLVGQEGTVLVSRDSGKSFTVRKHPSGKALSAVVQAADGSLLLFGENGVTRMDIR